MATTSYGETIRGSPAPSAGGATAAVARNSPAPSSYTPHQAAKAGVIPTNTVSYKEGVVRTRIDPVLPVSDVIRQLCTSLRIEEPPTRFALRDETDELVTNENLRKKIKAKSNLKYVGPYLMGYFFVQHPCFFFCICRRTNILFFFPLLSWWMADSSMRRTLKPKRY
jgi:hypothetical protein